jgi:hypothetical protein
MFRRRRRRNTTAEPRVAPPFLHDPDCAEDLAALLREFEGRRLLLIASGLPADDPHVRGLDAKLDSCRASLTATRVASIAIERSYERARLQG